MSGIKITPAPKTSEQLAKLVELQAVVESWGNEKATEVFIRTLQHAKLHIMGIYSSGLPVEVENDKDCMMFVEAMMGSLEEVQQVGHQ